MVYTELWKYCTNDQIKQLLLSYQLLADTQWTEEKQLACLYALSNTADQHYYSCTIPKANGRSRQLKIPDWLLKSVQRQLLHNCLEQLPVSPYAQAYRRGAGVKNNAAVHLGQKQVLNLDIQDFFGSIDFAMVYRWAFPGRYYPPEIRGLLTSLCCYKGYLPQGAPTSPAISNLVMKDFDEAIGRFCAQEGIAYTRYCDDLTFSGEFDAGRLKKRVAGYLQTKGFALNRAKTRIASRHQQQLVTGVVVNQKLQTTRNYRRSLRQELYYCRKWGFAEHLRYKQDEIYLTMGESGTRRYVQSLLGKVNYVLQINPQDEAFQEAAIWLKEAIIST